MQKQLSKLTYSHLRCVAELFGYGNLPYDENQDMDGLSPVLSEEFPDFSALEVFVRSVYTERMAQELLYCTFADKPLYLEKDGVLYVRLEGVSGAGYPARWEDFEICEISPQENRCTYQVRIPMFADDDDPVQYSVYICTATLGDDGNWRLESVAAE